MRYVMKNWCNSNYWGYVEVPEEIFNKIDRSLCTGLSNPLLLDLLANCKEQEHLQSLGIDTGYHLRYGWDYYKVGLLKEESNE